MLHVQNNKTRFIFYILYSEKTWAFDQSERAQGPVYIIIKDIAHNGIIYHMMYFT